MGCTGTGRESGTERRSNGEPERVGGKVCNLDPRVSQLVSMDLPVFMPLVGAKTPHLP